MYNKGIRFINVLGKEKGKFYNLQEIRESIGIPVNYLRYQGIIDLIKSYLLRVNIRLKQKIESKKISNDQELIQSDHTSCPINQKGNN